jgi:hypothetical protein
LCCAAGLAGVRVSLCARGGGGRGCAAGERHCAMAAHLQAARAPRQPADGEDECAGAGYRLPQRWGHCGNGYCRSDSGRDRRSGQAHPRRMPPRWPAGPRHLPALPGGAGQHLQPGPDGTQPAQHPSGHLGARGYHPRHWRRVGCGQPGADPLHAVSGWL